MMQFEPGRYYHGITQQNRNIWFGVFTSPAIAVFGVCLWKGPVNSTVLGDPSSLQHYVLPENAIPAAMSKLEIFIYDNFGALKSLTAVDLDAWLPGAP